MSYFYVFNSCGSANLKMCETLGCLVLFFFFIIFPPRIQRLRMQNLSHKAVDILIFFKLFSLVKNTVR